MDSELLVQKSIPELVQTYNEQIAKIKRAYEMLEEAEATIKEAFGNKGSFGVMPDYHKPIDTFRRIESKMHKAAWERFVERSEIRKVLSIAESEKLNKQLETGEDLPPITVENVMDTLKFLVGRGEEFAVDAIREVFNFLRPTPMYNKGYKTNKKFSVGKKVIMTWMVSTAYSRNIPYRVNYQREDRLMAIDRIFHVLDGNGIPKGYKSPLIDAINTSKDGCGETDYFIFKACKNGNLHLTFKRLDLLQELNRIGGDGTLKGSNT